MTKLYSTITDADIADIVNSWDGASSLDRHVNVWLIEDEFGWDPALTDDENRREFYSIADRCLAAARAS